MVDSNLKFMKEALKEAVKARKKNEVPVGAVITKDGKIISRAHSLVINLKDPTAHAEIVAIRKACKKIKNKRLTGCTMYVTLEPCAMCAGALVLSRIKELVYGADEPKTGGVRSVFRIADNKRLNHRVKVTRGILKDECAGIMKSFFIKKRLH